MGRRQFTGKKICTEKSLVTKIHLVYRSGAVNKLQTRFFPASDKHEKCKKKKLVKGDQVFSSMKLAFFRFFIIRAD